MPPRAERGNVSESCFSTLSLRRDKQLVVPEFGDGRRRGPQRPWLFPIGCPHHHTPCGLSFLACPGWSRRPSLPGSVRRGQSWTGGPTFVLIHGQESLHLPPHTYRAPAVCTRAPAETRTDRRLALRGHTCQGG